jgi:2,4-dienoyl-CoA reductase-like NADH-dependent reductase (Old Yellow Enzyme family)/thioredoxin reductase
MRRILEPIKVGNVVLKNRLMFLAMAKYLSSDDHFVSDREIAYYTNFAKNGVALLATGACIVDETSTYVMPNQLGLYDDKFIPGLKKLADSIHDAGGKLLIQLWRAGFVGHDVSPEDEKGPAQFSIEEIHAIQKKYRDAAARAKKAGADGVEFHIAHNYLPESFLVPLLNKRTDEYGADTVENGARFSLEAIEAIRYVCGSDFLIAVKLNGDDFTEGGMTIERAVDTAVLLEKASVDMISMSAGGSLTQITGMSADGRRPEGWKVGLAEAVKKKVSIPVVATGSLRHPEYIEEILSEGRCDMVGMGRGLLADPEWLTKLMDGRIDEQRYCISCMHCFDQYPFGETGCSINPLALREYQNIDLSVDGAGRKIVVVGAGPGGLEAAVTLKKRGFEPVIFEREYTLGGTERLAAVPFGKSKVSWHVDYYQRQVEKLGIELRLGTEATPQLVGEVDPYAVFIATGTTPIYPSRIPGIDSALKYHDVLEDMPEFSDLDVVVIGVGQVGTEIAITLALKGNRVTVIDMLEKQNITTIEGYISMGYSYAAGLNIQMSHKLLEVTETSVVAEDIATGETVEFKADKTILCMGGRPDTELYEQLKGTRERVYLIGDSSGTGKIRDAVQAAFNTAVELI